MSDLGTAIASTTEREVRQQPSVWREAGSLVAGERERIDAFLAPLLARPELRIVLTGAGTSAFAGEVLAPGLARRLGRRVEAVATTDAVSVPRDVFAEDVPTLLVSFARSGDSPESTAAVDLADRLLADVHHLVVTCDADGRLAREVGGRSDALLLVTPARANDRAFAMTSSFTTMTLMTWLAFTGDAVATVETLASAAEAVLGGAVDLDPVTGPATDRWAFLGSGPLKGLARESALKLLEVTAGRVDTAWDSPLGFRHGPKAVLGPRTAVVLYGSTDPYTAQYDADMVRELRGADSPVLVVGAEGSVPAGSTGLPLPGMDDDALLALPLVVVAQLLAIRVATGLGVAVDDPFPDGAVNRVVQGVVIHALTAR